MLTYIFASIAFAWAAFALHAIVTYEKREPDTERIHVALMFGVVSALIAIAVK